MRRQRPATRTVTGTQVGAGGPSTRVDRSRPQLPGWTGPEREQRAMHLEQLARRIADTADQVRADSCNPAVLAQLAAGWLRDLAAVVAGLVAR